MRKTRENFTMIDNGILERLISEPFTSGQLRIILLIIRSTLGWHKCSHELAISVIADRTGLTYRYTQKAVKDLLTQGVLKEFKQYSRSKGRTIGMNPKWISESTMMKHLSNTVQDISGHERDIMSDDDVEIIHKIKENTSEYRFASEEAIKRKVGDSYDSKFWNVTIYSSSREITNRSYTDVR